MKKRNEFNSGIEGSPAIILLVAFCLACTSVSACAQETEKAGADDPPRSQSEHDLSEAFVACEESFNSRNSCEILVKQLSELASRYSIDHPDLGHMCAASQSMCGDTDPDLYEKSCSICKSCAPPPKTPQFDAFREFLAISPQARLDMAVKTGDFRMLGRDTGWGHRVPCFVINRRIPDEIHLFPAGGDIISGPEHGALNIRAEFYARDYNLLLLRYLSENPQ